MCYNRASLTDGQVFTVLDLSGAYQQLEIVESSKPLFTINTHLGLYRFNRLTYKISSAPAIFQRTMDRILREIPRTCCYLDDVIIAGVSFEDCKRITELVLTRLSEYNIRINTVKSLFYQLRVEYLGHVISRDGVQPSASKIIAIKEAPAPSNITELRSYLGLVNYYRKFAPM